ncbi:MAG: hypothetical protein NTZ59_14160 [Bacteroidetes bacterium]|nr:hypothetical protein [Bacteroidota bacterium]
MENNNIDNNEQLLKYLDGKLDDSQLHEFEKEMLNDDLLNDAVEGLSALKNKKSIDVYVNDLNKHLKQYTASKKQRRLKHKLELNDWTLLAAFLIIGICIAAYFLIKKYG